MTPLVRSSTGGTASPGSRALLEQEGNRLQSDVELLRDEFGDLFEEAPIPYVHEGLDSRFIRANRAARVLLGVRADEVSATFGKSLIPDTAASRERLLDAFESIKSGREKIGVILELRRKDDGQVVWVEWSSKPAANGLYTRTMLVDITQRVLIEQTKAALEFSLESGHVGDWDLDLLSDTSRRSLRHDRCFGYESPVPDRDWGAVAFIRHVHPEDRDRVEHTMQSAVESLQEWSSEFRVVWPDETIHWLVAKGNTYRTTADGKAARMLGIVMDITGRKHAEEALVASEQLALRHVEALTRTLDSLTGESAPDRLAEHVLRTLAGQLGAQSCSVWLRDAASGMFDLQATLEGPDYLTRADLATQGVSLRIPMDEFWREDIHAGEISVMEDIRVLRDSAWRSRLMALGVVTVLMVPMFMGGTFDGTIGIRFNRKREFRRVDLDLARALANQTMLALQLARLSEKAREAAVVAERNRMAREIHDTLAQGFTGVIVQLEAAADATSKSLPVEAESHIARAKELARDSLREARRSVRALRPQELERNELSEAIEALIRKTTAGTSVSSEFVLSGEPRRLPPAWDQNLIRIVQEVLTNVLRHSGATSFSASIEFAAREVRLRLTDNGKGFDPSIRHDGFGLVGIAERVAEMGGSLAIDSGPAGGAALTIVLNSESGVLGLTI